MCFKKGQKVALNMISKYLNLFRGFLVEAKMAGALTRVVQFFYYSKFKKKNMYYVTDSNCVNAKS